MIIYSFLASMRNVTDISLSAILVQKYCSNRNKNQETLTELLRNRVPEIVVWRKSLYRDCVMQCTRWSFLGGLEGEWVTSSCLWRLDIPGVTNRLKLIIIKSIIFHWLISTSESKCRKSILTIFYFNSTKVLVVFIGCCQF